MSEEKDVGDETVVDKDDLEATESENVEVREEECEAKNLITENDQASETKEGEQGDIGPPSIPDDAEDKESKWCDDYQFGDDEKIAIDDYEGKDPDKVILLAAQNNELEILRKLLEKDSNLVNARDNDLYTPLHRASYSNNVEVIGILLSYDANVKAKTIDGWEPLHCACKWDSVEAVSLLIQNGADVNAQTKGNITPLHLAASNVYGRRTLELLLWHPHVDPNIKNDGGDTAYDIAVRSGPLGTLFEILEESVNVY